MHTRWSILILIKSNSRHGDLRTQFGSDFMAATRHYITDGYDQKLAGVLCAHQKVFDHANWEQYFSYNPELSSGKIKLR